MYPEDARVAAGESDVVVELALARMAENLQARLGPLGRKFAGARMQMQQASAAVSAKTPAAELRRLRQAEVALETLELAHRRMAECLEPAAVRRAVRRRSVQKRRGHRCRATEALRTRAHRARSGLERGPPRGASNRSRVESGTTSRGNLEVQARVIILAVVEPQMIDPKK